MQTLKNIDIQIMKTVKAQNFNIAFVYALALNNFFALRILAIFRNWLFYRYSNND